MSGLGLDLGLSMRSGLGSGWTPANLGASLLGWWDAEDLSTITQSGGAVTAWRDKVGGVAVTQAISSSRPIYSSTGFNGRPDITFDGSDDYLAYDGALSWPAGDSPSELWALVDQQAPAAEAATRGIGGYTGGNTSNGRTLRRTSGGAVNRGSMGVGDGASVGTANNTLVALDGLHVLRGIAGNGQRGIDVDATGLQTGLQTVATVASQVRIGTLTNSANFWLGGINTFLVTAALDVGQAAQLFTYLKARGGIV